MSTDTAGTGPNLLVSVSDGVMCLSLNRAHKRNAFDLALFDALAVALGQAEDDPAVRCVLLRAEGGHFTGGIDLPQWVPFFRDGRWPDLPAGAVDPLGLGRGRARTRPLVIAIHGLCLTIGIELALAADIRLAAADARFAQIEVKRGLYPLGGATLRMVQELGWGNAMRILLTGDEFSAEHAQRIGLVQDLCAPANLQEQALDLARRIARQSPVAVRATLRACGDARAALEREPIARLLDPLPEVMGSDDLLEGLRAFLERREPVFPLPR